MNIIRYKNAVIELMRVMNIIKNIFKDENKYIRRIKQ